MKLPQFLPSIAIISLIMGACTPKTKEKIVYVEVIREVEKEKLVEVAGSTTETDSGTKDAGKTGGTSVALVSTDVQMSGSLAVSTPGTLDVAVPFKSFSLAATDDETHSIYCTTFEEDPVACAATVTDWKFDQKCANYAGKTFGCFLRKGTKTLTTIEFGGDTSLVAGAGDLVSKITYNTETGLARAVVDEELSSALAADAVAAAMKAQGVETTVLPVMTGLWKTDCVDSPSEGIYCDPTDDPNYTTDIDVSKKYCKDNGTPDWTYSGTGTAPLVYQYYLCPENTVGVNVPEGYCYANWIMPPMTGGTGGGGGAGTAGAGGTTVGQMGGYGKCTVIYSYCFDAMNTAMQSMPECIAAKRVNTKDAIPTQLFLSEYHNEATDESKIAVWKDAASRNACVNETYTEAKPGFGLKLGTSVANTFNFFPFNLSTKAAMDGSIDEAIDRMAKWNGASSEADYRVIAKKLISLGSERESWRVEQCKNSPYSTSANPLLTDPIDASKHYYKCQFRLEEVTSYSWEDWSSGEPKTVTSSYPTWWWDTDDFKTNPELTIGDPLTKKWKIDTATMGLTSESVQCTFDAADGSGLPFCPPYASTGGTYTQYYKLDANQNKARLMLVCMVDQEYNYGSAESQHYYYLQQTPSPSDVMADAITAMAASSGCDPVHKSDSGHALAGLPKIQVEAIRRVAGELALSKNFEFERDDLCHGVDTAAGWDFNSCLNSNYGDAGYQLCWGKDSFQYVLGLTLETNGTADNHGVYTRAGECSVDPTANKTEAACASPHANWITGSCSTSSHLTEVITSPQSGELGGCEQPQRLPGEVLLKIPFFVASM